MTSEETSRSVRQLSWISLAGITVTVITFALLHILPPTAQISPVHRTISEYALTTSAWAFDLAVVSLVCASVATFAAAVLVRRIRVRSASTLFGALWAAGLLTLVSFPKHNWALGAISDSGQIHRMASLVAFVALPIAVMTLARRGDRPDRTGARWAFWLGASSLIWFLPILIAIAASPRTWWQEIPLGLIERGLALTEVSALIVVTILLRRSATVSSRARTPVR